jgi:hypothetical protein
MSSGILGKLQRLARYIYSSMAWLGEGLVQAPRRKFLDKGRPSSSRHRNSVSMGRHVDYWYVKTASRSMQGFSSSKTSHCVGTGPFWWQLQRSKANTTPDPRQFKSSACIEETHKHVKGSAIGPRTPTSLSLMRIVHVSQLINCMASAKEMLWYLRYDREFCYLQQRCVGQI